MKDRGQPQFRRGCVSSMSSSGPARRHLVILIVGLTLVTPAAYAQGSALSPRCLPSLRKKYRLKNVT